MRVLIKLMLLTTCLVACSLKQGTVLGNNELLATRRQPKVCAAVRGNGNLVMAHYGALGHYHEYYPIFDGFAGGSSASMTAFIYESMRLNPVLTSCGGAACTPVEARLRMSFLLKSVLGYVEAFQNADDVQALMSLGSIIDKLKNIFSQDNFSELLETKPSKVANDILKVLTSSDLNGIINPTLISPLRNLKNLPFHIMELRDNVNKFGLWEAADERIFLFPGFFNWQNFAQSIGRVADFYAGYHDFFPRERLDQLLTACAERLRGKLWEENVILADGRSCQGEMVELIKQYRSEMQQNSVKSLRIDEPIGKGMLSLVSTSVITGESLEAYKTAKNNYEWGRSFDLKFHFSDVLAGYFGPKEALDRIASNPQGYPDLRTEKFVPLGSLPWRLILTTSPAEPSLSEMQPLPAVAEYSEIYSAGGWVDLSPTLALRNAGCTTVVYFTRHVSLSAGPAFAGSIIKLLGATPEEQNSLIDPDPEREPPSSFSLATAEADAVWCTDWDTTSPVDFKEHFRAGYRKANASGLGETVQFLTDADYFKAKQSNFTLRAPRQGRRACIRP